MKRPLKVGVREFRERIAAFLESDVPVTVTRHGETVGVYIPTGNRPNTADIGDLKAAADRLAEALRNVDEEELVQEFRQRRRQPKKVGEKLQPTAGEDVA